jgi:NADPH:quinone reductase-like Zn-dependent oxidoreductase
LGTVVRTKAAFCQTLKDGDTWEQASAIPTAFASALHGLTELGRLTKGDTVLIQSAAASIGLAACQIARTVGAEIYVTVKTAEEAKHLEANLGIGKERIFCFTGMATAGEILNRSGRKGFDVIFSNVRGEELPEYWKCIAAFGRFIDIACADILDSGKLGMDTFQRSASFSSFDLKTMGELRPELVSSLVAKIGNLRSDGVMSHLPVRAIQVSDINELAKQNAKNSIGAVALAFDVPTDTVDVHQAPFETSFSSEASYLLVGCLGGLGRSFAEWMVSRGARKLVFLSRTGTAGLEAQRFISRLRSLAVDAQIIRGDVTSAEDVSRAVQSCANIKGVIQAALTLHDAFFGEMSWEDFKATMEPRVLGTMNLHRALKDVPLDFFVTWSSWTTVFGSASQSNYMAANAFMDAFAEHRRGLGLPATSLALGQILDVGIVSYHPQFQEHLLRMGLYGNTEDEFIRSCEASILNSSPVGSRENQAGDYGIINKGHLLAGVEPAGLLAKDKKYPVKNMSWYLDPRFSWLVQSIKHQASDSSNRGSTATVDDDKSDTPINRIHGKVSRLLYIPKEDIDTTRPIKSYGIDSMVAAELRRWTFSSFGTDISLLKLLHPSTTVEKLAGWVTDSGSSE